MTGRMKTAVKAIVAGSALSLLAGCATVERDEFEALKAEVGQLRSLAEQASDDARNANACCAANTERMERVFKKSMMK